MFKVLRFFELAYIFNTQNFFLENHYFYLPYIYYDTQCRQPRIVKILAESM